MVIFVNVEIIFFLGCLNFDVILKDFIVWIIFVGVVIGGVVLLWVLMKFKFWGYFWNEWFILIDYKKIGIMYMIFGLIMFVCGFVDVIMMCVQQVMVFNGSEGYLNVYYYDQIFMVYGVIMIFFVVMFFVMGLMNYVVLLQIGVCDVFFLFLNNFLFWMMVGGVVIVMVLLFVGEFVQIGWLVFLLLLGIVYSFYVGVDYYIWGLQVVGVGMMLLGINLMVMILKMCVFGMIMMKMFVFIWIVFCMNILIVVLFFILIMMLILLMLDRYLGMNFFINDFGGNLMMYINFIWIWGYFEVYILILLLFGVFLEIILIFLGKCLFGYILMVYVMVCIMVLFYVVWLYYFFIMGLGVFVNLFFGIIMMIILILMGVKIFNWLFIMYYGWVCYDLLMMWVIVFMLIFIIGGMIGVLLVVFLVDFVLYNLLFLIVYFYNVIIGGVVFGVFVVINFWWFKVFGFKLNVFWGKVSFWCWVIGFWVVFMLFYIFGLMGVICWMCVFDDFSLQIWFIIVVFGVVLIVVGIGVMFLQFGILIWKCNELEYCDNLGDLWGGCLLEWVILLLLFSYNFVFIFVVYGLDVWFEMKVVGVQCFKVDYILIYMLCYIGLGVIIVVFCIVFGMVMIWYIWWFVIVFFIGIVGYLIYYIFNYDCDYYIFVDEVWVVEDVCDCQLVQGV